MSHTVDPPVAYLLLTVSSLLAVPGCSDATAPGPREREPPTETDKLMASDGAAGDYFGASVAVSGETAVIGADGDDDDGPDSGSAYVFERSGGAWSQVAKLTASDGTAEDHFGRAVAVSGDVAVIGAWLDDVGGVRDAGSAYVFERSGGIWSEIAHLTASDGAPSDVFGTSVAVSGNVAVVGAEADDDNGSSSGSAYVFERSDGAWSQVAKLIPSDGAMNDGFGVSVGVSGDVVAVGSWRDDASAFRSGSVYVFERSGATWSQTAKLTAGDGAADDFLGSAVAVSGDVIVGGAFGSDNDDGVVDTGSAYVFERSGGAWSQMAKLTASDGAMNDGFGTSVAVSEDLALVGASTSDGDGSNFGAAYLFEHFDGAWTQVAKLTASDGAELQRFGEEAALGGRVAVIGAYGTRGIEGYGDKSGAVYVYAIP